jgi:hypothetical protein
MKRRATEPLAGIVRTTRRFIAFPFQHRAKMTMAALATFAAPMSASAVAAAPAAKPHRASIGCAKSGERVSSGLNKICYYACAKWEGAMTKPSYEHCPSWTIRWRLNHDSYFGPKPKSASR